MTASEPSPKPLLCKPTVRTVLQDIFYSVLARDSHLLGVSKHRRIHFNAAMLEVRHQAFLAC